MRQASRRAFLFEVTGGTVLLPGALAALGKPAPLPETAPGDPTYWEMVRRQFSFREERVPMNAANLCPSPRVVAERVTDLTHDIDVDCSFNNRAKFKDLLEESRAKVAGQLGVTADEIALVRNTSEANNTVNNGIALESGDEVVLWDQNHPTNNVAWDVRAARFGLTVTRVSVPKHPESPDQLVEVFERAITPRTRVLSVTHVSNVSGIQLPVKRLAEIAHRHGIHFHVDGAQTWGALDVNLRDIGCDSYSASAHKWFMGPKEAGVLYVKADRIPSIWPNIVAPGWGTDVDPDPKGARKFESLGQRDDACLSAVGTTVDFHRAIGSDRIEARVHELASTLKAGVRDAGLKLVTPLDAEMSGGVCIVEAPREARAKVLDTLYHEHGIFGAGSGGIRLCPHLYNTMEHVERAIRGVTALRDVIRA